MCTAIITQAAQEAAESSMDAPGYPAGRETAKAAALITLYGLHTRLTRAANGSTEKLVILSLRKGGGR